MTGSEAWDVRWTEHRFISFDETPIFYRRLDPSNLPQAVAIIVHGLGEHGGRYRAFAEYLVGLGCQCYVPDLRGFGKSGGKRACVKRFSDFQNDLEALRRWIWRTHKSLPSFLIGHSFGGLVASSTLSRYPEPQTTGLVLISPIFGIAIQVPAWRHWLGLIASCLIPDYVQSSRVNPKLLTHDAEILKAYGNDPLISHKISAGLYRELWRQLSRKDQIAVSLYGPILVLQAGQDFIVSKKNTLNFYKNLKAKDKELEVYDDLYHELLNETKRDVIYSRIGSWISKHIR